MCYKKSGHLIIDCPSFQATTSKRIPMKKAMMASWDDDFENESEEDVNITNMCFMANNDNLTKVHPKPVLDDDLTMDKLAKFF